MPITVHGVPERIRRVDLIEAVRGLGFDPAALSATALEFHATGLYATVVAPPPGADLDEPFVQSQRCCADPRCVDTGPRRCSAVAYHRVFVPIVDE